MTLPSVTRFRRCSRCKLLKPRTAEFFSRNRTEKDGLRPECKGCRRCLPHTTVIGGREPVEVKCRDCGRTFTSNPSRVANGRDKYCSMACRLAPNATRIEGDIAYIKLADGARRVVGETKVDLGDLHRILATGSRLTVSKEDGGLRAWIRVEGEKAYLHRFLTDAPSDADVDHINSDTLDNRRSNLRLVTHAQNMQNRRGASRNSKSGIRNVHWDSRKRKWNVHLVVNGKTITVGRFKDLADAESAAIQARRKYMTFSER